MKKFGKNGPKIKNWGPPSKNEKLLLDRTPPTTCPLFLAMYVHFLGPEILTVFDMVIFCLTGQNLPPSVRIKSYLQHEKSLESPTDSI